MRYPKIPGLLGLGSGPCVVFEKLDGTNLRATQTEDGWRYFTRSDREITELDPWFGNFPSMVDDIESKLIQLNMKHYYFEFLGRHSFAGQHVEGEKHNIFLLDCLDDEMMNPFEFVRATNKLQIATPPVIHSGKLPGNLIESVRSAGRWGKHRVTEGVVIKGNNWMCKVKTNTWQEKLRTTKFKGYWIDSAGIEHRVEGDNE